jgi:hypothetical protein
MKVMADSWTRKVADKDDQIQKRSNVQHIMLMDDVLDEMVNSISLYLSLTDIREEFVDSLVEKLNAHWGNKDGKSFEIFVHHNNLEMKLRTRKAQKLNLNHELMHVLDSAGIDFKLNK